MSRFIQFKVEAAPLIYVIGMTQIIVTSLHNCYILANNCYILASCELIELISWELITCTVGLVNSWSGRGCRHKIDFVRVDPMKVDPMKVDPICTPRHSPWSEHWMYMYHWSCSRKGKKGVSWLPYIQVCTTVEWTQEDYLAVVSVTLGIEWVVSPYPSLTTISTILHLWTIHHFHSHPLYSINCPTNCTLMLAGHT